MSASAPVLVRAPRSWTQDLEITGTETVNISAFPSYCKRFTSVRLTLKESAAGEVNKASWLSAVIAADGQSFVAYAWKDTAAGDTTLIAATAAVTVVAEVTCDTAE